MLRRLTPEDARRAPREPAAPEALTIAAGIVEDIRARGETALREHAERLDGLAPGAPLHLGPDDLRAAYDAQPEADRALLDRTAARIRSFALAQRETLRDLTTEIPGGRVGHTVSPVRAAGCYAPGGRFPLPSSALMTAMTARAAGVERVWVAAPRPSPITIAAAHVSGAEGVLAAGGAQAIAALAFGCGPVPTCDVIVGPGNRFVTAAKKLVFGWAAIDMLAGPSELVVVADGGADPRTVAIDLLAQAEHDPEAIPALVSLDPNLPDAVDRALEEELGDLPTAETAGAAVRNGFAVVVRDLCEAASVCDAIAPEHLHLHLRDASSAAGGFSNYGALFVGGRSAEALGDYGAGPNHVLPTGGTARYTGGLSVLNFLRVRTWMELTDPLAAGELTRDAVALARHEGLEAHARSAERRLPRQD